MALFSGGREGTQRPPTGRPSVATDDPVAAITDPAGLVLVSRLELIARTAVQGLLSGLHPSPTFGSSVEYADHRPYTPSDELRSLDWKLLAKTDRYFVKLFEERTNTRVTVILDTSRSMGFSGDPSRLSKLDFGRFLAAAICHLALTQNDAAGLATFDSAVRSYVPARSGRRHFRHVLATLATTRPGADTSLGSSLRELAGRIPRRGIVVLVSDLLDEPEELAAGLSLLKHLRHDLVVFHLVDPVERDFPFEKVTRFRDMEGEGRIVTNPREVRAAYLDRFDRFTGSVRTACLERRIGYELTPTDSAYADMLAAYLARRGRLTA
ncbi:MAG: DUF58 domain-containing protein [Planctomycetaceae bacterium]